VQLRVDLFRLGLHPDVYERLKRIAGSRVTSGGELLITARRYRTQEANRADARRRVAEMIAAAHIAPHKRKATRPSKAAKAQRVDQKKQRGSVKQTRGKVVFD
jgi:ribosome-associated protein